MWREANAPVIASVPNVIAAGITRLSTDKGEPAAGSEPKPLRLTPGRNQKRRSKLNQTAEASSHTTPTPAPPSPPPPPPAPPPNPQPSLRRTRFKRSGQMRDDLLQPDESAPPAPEDEY